MLMLSAPVSFAGVLSAVGDSFTANFELAPGDTDPNGNTNVTGETIKADVDFTLYAFDEVNDYLDLEITATNTTAPNSVEIGLWKLGFGVDPDAQSLSFMDDPDGELVKASLSAFPAFPDSALIDITTETGPGMPRTLQSGESDTFWLRLTFSDLLAGTDVTIYPVNAFFQSGAGSYQLGEPPISVPAPAALLLLLMGIVAVRLMNRSAAR